MRRLALVVAFAVVLVLVQPFTALRAVSDQRLGSPTADLAHAGSVGASVQGPRLPPAATSTPTQEVSLAFQANTGNLWTAGKLGTGDQGLGMARGTSPSIAAAGGGHQIAFQANTGRLWTVGALGARDFGLGMMPGTSPSIAAVEGGYQIAFQANTSNLWTAGTQGTGDQRLGMAPATSPDIAAQAGGYQIAFQANTTSLWTVGVRGAQNFGLGMMARTSPGIAAVSGGYQIAFQANTSNLWTAGTQGTGDQRLGMAPATSPSIAPVAAGHQTGFQANTTALWTTGALGTENTQLGLLPGTSPDLVGLAPATSPGGKGLPSKIVGGYWQRWQGPHVSEITANAPQYNVQYAAVCQSAAPGTGRVSFHPDFSGVARFKADLAASKAAGSTWLLTVGGGGDGGIVLRTESNAREMVDSLIPIIDAYSFQGVDWDLEGETRQWTSSAMKSASLQLKARYGPDFVISAAPRPYEDWYRAWAVEMGDALDLFGYQFYDFPETNDTAFLRSYVQSRIAEAVRMGIPARKLLIGAITSPTYSGGHNTVEVYRDIFKAQERIHPELRGVFVWETSLDKRDGWRFARLMGPAVRGV